MSWVCHFFYNMKILCSKKIRRLQFFNWFQVFISDSFLFLYLESWKNGKETKDSLNNILLFDSLRFCSKSDLEFCLYILFRLYTFYTIQRLGLGLVKNENSFITKTNCIPFMCCFAHFTGFGNFIYFKTFLYSWTFEALLHFMVWNFILFGFPLFVCTLREEEYISGFFSLGDPKSKLAVYGNASVKSMLFL